MYVTARGLSTSLVPYGDRAFDLEFDFTRDRLTLATTDGGNAGIELAPKTVAAFYCEVMDAMAALEMPVEISTMPNEIAGAVPFPDDTAHCTYVPAHARALWRALVQAHRVLTRFRAGYLGKASPVHFFWGSFDLAVTRFSGRSAPEHPGGLPNFPVDVAREAYSHEVTSVGFWPGNADAPTPILYSYAYPTPGGFSEAAVEPAGAFWLSDLGEFVLPYDAVRTADDPDAALLRFAESTHAAAADLAGWERSALECAAPLGPDWWRARRGRVAE